MFARLAFNIAKPAAARPIASGATRVAFQVRFYAAQSTAGSKGREMPIKNARGTAPVASLPATFTIRVCIQSV